MSLAMIIDQSRRRLFRGRTIRRLVLATFAMAAGAFLAPTLAEAWRSPSRVDVVLAAEGAIVDDPVFAALSKHIQSPQFLDGLAAELRLQQDNEWSVGETTTIGLVRDLILGSETTVADREAALRAQLAASITLASAAAGQTLTISASADDAATASRLANAAARRLSSDAGSLDLSLHDPDTEQLRLAAEKAEAALVEFTTELGPQKLAALRLAEGETRALSDEIASTDRRLAEITRRLEHVSRMTVSDVLARPLPDSLDFTTLDYHRQRHVEAKLQMDQLSNQLGPRHPRLLSASGAVDAAAKDIQSALTKLSGELRRQQEGASAQLADQRNGLTARVTETGEQVERLKVLEGEAETSREAYDLALRSDAGGDARGLFLIPLNQAALGQATSESLPNVAVVGLGAAGGLMAALAVSFSSARRRDREIEPAPAAWSDDQEPWCDGVAIPAEAPEDPHHDLTPAPFEPTQARDAADQFPEGGLLTERIREILCRHAVPANEVQPLPPLIAAAIAAAASSEIGEQSRQLSPPLPEVDNDHFLWEQEVWQLQREMAALRDRVERRGTGRG